MTKYGAPREEIAKTAQDQAAAKQASCPAPKPEPKHTPATLRIAKPKP
jgi:hypothetical protein